MPGGKLNYRTHYSAPTKITGNTRFPLTGTPLQCSYPANRFAHRCQMRYRIVSMSKRKPESMVPGNDNQDTTAEALERLRERVTHGLPAHLCFEVAAAAPGSVTLRLAIQPFHMAPNGYLHAATLVALADTASGFGCVTNLPAGASNFTTAELKTNFLRTATAGVISCKARLVHGGRRTQVWDATVVDEQGRALALFRCTQMLIYEQA